MPDKDVGTVLLLMARGATLAGGWVMGGWGRAVRLKPGMGDHLLAKGLIAPDGSGRYVRTREAHLWQWENREAMRRITQGEFLA